MSPTLRKGGTAEPPRGTQLPPRPGLHLLCKVSTGNATPTSVPKDLRAVNLGQGLEKVHLRAEPTTQAM